MPTGQCGHYSVAIRNKSVTKHNDRQIIFQSNVKCQKSDGVLGKQIVEMTCRISGS
jgi:hypothetical protein